MKIIKKITITFVMIFIIICFVILGLLTYHKNKKYYTAEDFGIQTVKSNTDYDNDRIDDYTDILEGAKIEAKNKPTYKSAYYSGGYPPENEGVCTDCTYYRII